MRQETFDITGMTCSACSGRVGKAVGALGGVADVNVNLLKNSMTVRFDESALSSGEIIAAVTKAGYGAVPRPARGNGAARPGKGADPALAALAGMRRRLVLSLLFTLPLMYISMGHMFALPLPGFLAGEENALAFAFTQFLLTVPVIWVNAVFYRVGLKTLVAGAPNMDSLIAIGSGAAASFGVFAIYKMAFAMGQGDMATVRHFAANLYFESAAMILTLITLGKFFEARAKGRTSDAIARLMDLAPKTATVLRDGEEASVLLEEVAAGDVLVVKAGESVPVDGVITEGRGFLDESAISGESLPLEKNAGDSVTGATINSAGHFLMRATRVGDDTTLAQIIRLVDEATSSKAPIARLADTVSGIFVPVVIAIAAVAAGAWLLLGYGLEFALSIGIAVLVISCPCALGLATPTAIMVGTGRGAAGGILLKSAEAIETAGRIDTVVLDKTGTVTGGRPVVTDIEPVAGMEADALLGLAGSLEKLSEHPLGAAVVREAKARGLPLFRITGFTQVPGQGVTGMADGVRYMAGNEKMLRAEGVEAEVFFAKGEALAKEGKTVLYFARGLQALGLIAVADAIKPGSREAVAEFLAMGVGVLMLTGDNAKTAEAIRRQAGIPQVLSDLLPQDKEREIRQLQERGKKVAMIGDGINDAPALARADVGIAIGAGTDVAIASADIVLMKSDLMDAVNAVKLSRAVMRTIRQNLFWAFFYNAVGIPVAAGVFYTAFGWTLSPMLAAAAMSMSSLSVVGNALRLRFFTPGRLARTGGSGAGDAPEGVLAPAVLPQQTTQRKESMKIVIRIEGMSCGHCTGSVEKALKSLDGVNDAVVDLAAKTATVDVSGGVSGETLKKAVTDLGFTVVGME